MQTGILKGLRLHCYSPSVLFIGLPVASASHARACHCTAGRHPLLLLNVGYQRQSCYTDGCMRTHLPGISSEPSSTGSVLPQARMWFYGGPQGEWVWNGTRSKRQLLS